MEISWEELAVNFEHIEREAIVKEWRWLIGDTAQPILISAVGDAFLEEENGEILWLITGSGELEKVADSFEEFEEKLNDEELVHDWFLVSIVSDFIERGFALSTGNLLGFKTLPIFGGEYEAENYQEIDIETYFDYSGKMNYKVKDLPDGAEVEVPEI